MNKIFQALDSIKDKADFYDLNAVIEALMQHDFYPEAIYLYDHRHVYADILLDWRNLTKAA